MTKDLITPIHNLCELLGMTIAVDFRDFGDGEHLAINEDRVYPGASLIKFPIAVHILELVSEEKVGLDDIIELDLSKPEYQQPMGSGVITNMGSQIAITIKDLLMLSLAESDNLATNELLKLTTFQKINESLSRFGLTSTRATVPIHNFGKLKEHTSNPITAREIGLLYEKLFHEEIPLSHLLIDLLSMQKYTSRIPFFLPEFDDDLLVAHKTGSVGTFLHDAGLIIRPEFSYGITLLGEGNSNWLTTSMALARVSELVYIYMVRKHTGQELSPVSLNSLEPRSWAHMSMT